MAAHLARIERINPRLNAIVALLDGDADAVFLTLRAFSVATLLGPLLERHRDQLKPEAIWKIEQGPRRASAESGGTAARTGAACPTRCRRSTA
jgi:hypothetical protein